VLTMFPYIFFVIIIPCFLFIVLSVSAPRVIWLQPPTRGFIPSCFLGASQPAFQMGFYPLDVIGLMLFFSLLVYFLFSCNAWFYSITCFAWIPYIGLLVGESNTLLDWGNMVDVSSEAKSSATGVTHPYRRTEHCDKIHEYRCDKEVGVIGIDISKEHLITSRGRVRKYENNLKGYEEILKMKPCVIVLELW